MSKIHLSVLHATVRSTPILAAYEGRTEAWLLSTLKVIRLPISITIQFAAFLVRVTARFGGTLKSTPCAAQTFLCELQLIRNLNFVVRDDRCQYRKLFDLVHRLLLLV